MLTHVDLYTNSRTMTLSLNAEDPNQKYIIKDITGLGPVPAAIMSSNYGAEDGDVYNNSRLGSRNIVMILGYRPDYRNNESVSELRQSLYNLLPPKGRLTLRFMDDRKKTVEIKGYVETHEPVLFSAEPQVQISIFCPNALFYELAPAVINSFVGSYVDPSRASSADTGFTFELFVNTGIDQFILGNFVEQNIIYKTPMLPGDIIKISTEPGARGVWRTTGNPSTTKSDLLSMIQGSLSMKIGPDITQFRVYQPAALNMPYRLTFTPKYIGI